MLDALADGPGAWLASRAAGLTAYLALTIEIALGLFVSAGLADAWIARARSAELHRWLSRGALSLVVAHASALLLDTTVRFDVVDVLVPFASNYRPFAVGLGVVALWLGGAIHASFGLRPLIGAGAWRALHRASFVVFALATTHGLLAGTDASGPTTRLIYLGSTALVAGLLLARLARPGRPQRAG